MRRKNVGVCHGCRSTQHFLNDCPVKRGCPWCSLGWEKCFEVERKTDNRGRLFKTCSNNCGYFFWVENEEFYGESSTRTEAVIDEVGEDLAAMFDSLAQIAEKRDVEITLNVTFRKAKGSAEVNGKGKGRA
ncbi:Hypothetical predicted protein [Olea europaea subsp. europaea]|uniref:Uncharacterized protein n=1 Tax=Olea europaea subsp. europaea TaxID=158383 RepID=A0A8S0U6W0_OLEEU|nr:Hypothetical predicted protein [Olea europaea subsp. europaea]